MRLHFVLLLAGLVLVSVPVVEVDAHSGSDPTTVTVPTGPSTNGGTHRAACDQSLFAGNWTYTVTAVSGNVSTVTFQIYANANPTKTASDPTGPYKLCISCADAGTRAQAPCSMGACVGSQVQLANVKIKNPSVGSQVSVPDLPAGSYCIRIGATGGTGGITGAIGHP